MLSRCRQKRDLLALRTCVGRIVLIVDTAAELVSYRKFFHDPLCVQIEIAVRSLFERTHPFALEIGVGIPPLERIILSRRSFKFELVALDCIFIFAVVVCVRLAVVSAV